MSDQPHKEIYRIKGVSVDKYTPVASQDKPAVIMVHGGEHGSWCWEQWASYLCGAGYEVHALNWYDHGDSDKLPEADFIKRSIVDVAHKEIAYVAEQFDRPPILIGHSMGGLASALYATRAPLERLVLVTPVLPAAVHPEPVPIPVDATKAFPVLPYPQSKEFFYTALPDADAQQYVAKLVPESAQAVIEATQWTVNFNITSIKAPVFVLSAELDRLIPLEALRRYAQLLKAEYKEMSGIGHCDVLLKEPDWRDAAGAVKQWLAK